MALLDAQTPCLIAASSRDDWDRARLYGRTATGLLRYHFWMADTSPGRMARLLGLRDSMMAANLLALAERGPALVHAHNRHLQRDKSTMRLGGMPLEWWSAGALVGARLGEGYAFLATALGTIRHHGVGAPPPDTVEGLLYALPEDRYVVDAPRLAAILDDAQPAPACPPGSATSRWTRPTWPETTGSCSSRTSRGARFLQPRRDDHRRRRRPRRGAATEPRSSRDRAGIRLPRCSRSRTRASIACGISGWAARPGEGGAGGRRDRHRLRRKTGFPPAPGSIHSPRTTRCHDVAARALTSEGSRPCAIASLSSFPGHGTR
ncbi:erythromycin esterase family protein [Streptosporangium lutulentum]